MPAVYPSAAERRKPAAAPGCPAFPSKDTVMWRPDGNPAHATTVAPGQFQFVSDSTKYHVVWWDPHILALDAGTSFGLRRDDLIAKDGDAAGSGARLAAYREWEAARAAAIA